MDEPVAVGGLAGLADGHDHAAPIRVLAGDRRLHQRRVGDGKRDPARGFRRLGAGHPHRDELRRPLSVLHHLMGEIEQQLGEGHAEVRQPRIVREPDARRAARRRRAGGEQQERVARRGVAVDGDGVEGRVGGGSEDLAQRPGLDRGVGEEEGEHGRHVRRDHAGALGDAVDGDGHALDLGLPRGELRDRCRWS